MPNLGRKRESTKKSICSYEIVRNNLITRVVSERGVRSRGRVAAQRGVCRGCAKGQGDPVARPSGLEPRVPQARAMPPPGGEAGAGVERPPRGPLTLASGGGTVTAAPKVRHTSRPSLRVAMLPCCPCETLTQPALVVDNGESAGPPLKSN